MPTVPLPSEPNIDHLRNQVDELIVELKRASRSTCQGAGSPSGNRRRSRCSLPRRLLPDTTASRVGPL